MTVLCECGCGEEIPALRSDGRPARFKHAHNLRVIAENRMRNAKPRVTSHGYVAIGSRGYQHRIVAEQLLGRPLARGEQVHHKNGDKQDNRPENLEVLTVKEHRQRHFDIVTDAEIAELLLLGYGTHVVGKRCRAGTHRVSRIRGELEKTSKAPLLAWKGRGFNPLWGPPPDRLSKPAVVCAWCQRELSAGTSPVSHGLCPDCRATHFPESNGPAAHLSASTTGPSTRGV